MIYKKYDRISRLVTAILLMLVNLVIVKFSCKLSRLACNLKFGVYTFQPNFKPLTANHSTTVLNGQGYAKSESGSTSRPEIRPTHVRDGFNGHFHQLPPQSVRMKQGL